MRMTRDEARQYIRQHPEEYLGRYGKAKKDGGFICPVCGNGSGPDGTGLTTKGERTHYSCWRGCFTWADVIDIIAIKQNIPTGTREAMEAAYKEYGITVQGSEYSSPIKPPASPPPTRPDPPAKEEPPKDYTAYLDACHQRIGELDNNQLRGLTAKTINRFKLGYDPAYRSRGNRGTWKALIIPNGPYAFTVRNLDPEAPKGSRYDVSLGARPIFNQEALTGDTPVFITEGEIDALSIIEVGGEAVALGGTQGANKLLQLLAEHKPAKPLILALDKDETGQTNQAKLAEQLEARGIPYLLADLTGEYNDANAAYNSLGSADFVMAVHTTLASITSAEDKARQLEREAYEKITAAANLDTFFEDIKKGRETFATGLPILDEELKGGLYEGLTIIGAVSSAGKTTLAMQMADNMAKAGRDVLIFSLETPRREIMARSLSRETLRDSFQLGIHDEGGMTYNDILSGKKGETLEPAITAYRQYAGGLFIFESLGKIGTKRIWDEVARHKLITGNRPVVFVDYLQLLGPNDSRVQGAKDIMDAAVTDLKNLSAEYKIPVVLISSFNRDNYKTDANMGSFKESGGIEYSADLLLGLQYEGAGSKGWNQEKLEEAAQANPRKMELKIMKNRTGAWGQRITMDYYAPFNLFHETGVRRGGRT